MKKLMGFIVGAICGAAVGAVIALIITPASGDELRRDMKEKWNEVLEEARRAQKETQEKLENEFGHIQGNDR